MWPLPWFFHVFFAHVKLLVPYVTMVMMVFPWGQRPPFYTFSPFRAVGRCIVHGCLSEGGDLLQSGVLQHALHILPRRGRQGWSQGARWGKHPGHQIWWISMDLMDFDGSMDWFNQFLRSTILRDPILVSLFAVVDQYDVFICFHCYLIVLLLTIY